MSRLESFRRRLTAQIDGLNWAMAEVAPLPGDVVELGLGNGRTYDHLRRYSGKRVWVIDRVLQCHPDSTPPEPDFLQGDADVMLQHLIDKGAKAALIHADLGNGDAAFSAQVHLDLSPFIAALLMPGGLAVSQEPLAGLTKIAGPDGVPEARYHFYRKPK